MSAALVILLVVIAALAVAGVLENTARGRALIDAVDRRITGADRLPPPPVRYPFPDHDAEPGDWRS